MPHTTSARKNQFQVIFGFKKSKKDNFLVRTLPSLRGATSGEKGLDDDGQPDGHQEDEDPVQRVFGDVVRLHVGPAYGAMKAKAFY